MNDLRKRQLLIGAMAGLLAGLIAMVVVLLLTGETVTSMTSVSQAAVAWAVHLILSILIGLTYALLFSRVELGYAENFMSGLVYGLLTWIVFHIILLPLIFGQGVRWDIEAATTTIPALIAYLLQGGLLGLGYHLLHILANRNLGVIETFEAEPAPVEVTQRVVILGGGFAGATTAQYLEKLVGDDHSISITLVSNTNHLLFTPMLSEVTASGVEGQHISPALRNFFRRVRVIRGEPTSIDLDNRMIHLETHTSAAQSLPFDHLVLSIGMVPNFFGNENVERHAFTFKSLADAMRIRNHILDTLEKADVEPHPEKRRAMLSFVVVGGGFAGIELIGGLNDFIRGTTRWYYPNIQPEDVEIVLIHTRDRILPELSEELSRYALERMEARGVTFRLNSRVTDAAPGKVMIGDEIIETATLIWTAGNKPHPLLDTLPVEHNQRGSVVTNAMMAVPGQTSLWALGDNAEIPDLVTGGTTPPTAQYAIREAKTLAHNIHAIIKGAQPKEFHFKSLGQLAVVGHQIAVAEVMGIRFSGLLAWLLWRGIYLSKLPTLEKKIRVLIDWVVDIFFPRDIVYFEFPIESTPEDQPTTAEMNEETIS
jgi:NADH dehydrogenase